jgi:hypothetical protein
VDASGKHTCNTCGATAPKDSWNRRRSEDAIRLKVMDLERQLAAYDRYLEAEDSAIRAKEIIAENIRLKDELRMLARQGGGNSKKKLENVG